MSAATVRKAVIPSAGFGTRFLPATKAIPKEMVPVVDKPMIQYAVEEATSSGVQSIGIVTSRWKRAIFEHFGHSPQIERFLAEKGRLDLLEALAAIGRPAEFTEIDQA